MPNLEDCKEISYQIASLPLHIVFHSFLYKKMDKRYKNAMKHSTLQVNPNFFLNVS